jgi:hypothetical protein
MSYLAFVLFQKTKAPSKKDIATIINDKLSYEKNSHKRFFSCSLQIISQEKTIEINWGDFSAKLFFVETPSVLVESQEIANKFIHDPIISSFIASCDARIEVICEEDVDMDYFNIYIYILEALVTLPNVIVFETASENLL